MKIENQQCFLYRHFDRNKNLLYVGISLSAIRRLKQHYDHSKWAKEITYVTIEDFPCRNKALEAELRAIQIENPKYNIKCRKPNIRKMRIFEREAKIKIDLNEYFDINGNFLPGAHDEWYKFKAKVSREYSFDFWERIKRIERIMTETLEFIENYNTDYPPEDGIPRSVNVYF